MVETATLDYADMTLDELRVALAPEIAANAIFDGWSDTALVTAADAVGANADVARLAFPGGAMDMIDAWIVNIDLAMIDAFPAERIASLKIRERIRELIAYRLEAVTGLEESVRRATAIMAMPQNARRALKTGWRSADEMWRLAGDTATDYNHYTKRAILASIYAATLAVFVDDQSEGKQVSYAFLDRRIDGVMKFEKAKAQLLGGEREYFSISRFLGRLRYPTR
ncbi:COQ9 family protein [Altererythrobacter arenosus]|uniref:COQ9 family protein n=1 Tax=Altererythrobacter arenosus TaxID=3032592 RepID=A0ABY8FVC2_9SPHN|nr:COQ9 family protein [Altererythrobacter sp. CAU 1644]WFL78205.1 COQ9 family protein [Altererythrobacter sp. CAU 1644]